MKYAIFKTGGKQYKASKGDVIDVEHLEGKVNEEVVLPEVLLYVSDGSITVGKPNVPNVLLKAKILGQTKGEKIRVSKYKAKVRYRRVKGHRQEQTRLQIQTIQTDGHEKGEAEKKSETKAKRVKKSAK